MPQFMIFVKGDADSEAGRLPEPEFFVEMGNFNKAMLNAGVMLAANGLEPLARSVKVRYDGERRSVVDGPFTEVTEVVGGYWIIEVASREEAIEWMKRAPFREGEVELRRIMMLDEYRDLVPPEVIEAQKAMAERLGRA